jgi:capsular polysaccharide biosynthesis protein
MNQGVDSKALVTTIITKIPLLLIIAVTGAVIGSGLNLVLATQKEKDAKYLSETEYYIEFAQGRYEAKDYYNAYTWNDVIATDLILGKAMDILGEGYDREYVKSTITANIYSDVRYLNITVGSKNYDEVAAISAALEPALVEFGENMSEFTSIYKIEDLGISKEIIPHFTLRVAILFAFIFGAIALFIIIFRFCLGSSFYTKRQIRDTLDIPVFGIEFKNGKYEGVIDIPSEKYNDRFFVSKNDNDNLIAIIPFGKPYREIIIDEIDNVRLLGKKVTGAVMTGADNLWYKIYKGW